MTDGSTRPAPPRIELAGWLGLRTHYLEEVRRLLEVSAQTVTGPAVTIARGLSDTFAGIRPADVPAFIAAPLAGALVASSLSGWLFAERRTVRGTATAAAERA